MRATSTAPPAAAASPTPAAQLWLDLRHKAEPSDESLNPSRPLISTYFAPSSSSSHVAALRALLEKTEAAWTPAWQLEFNAMTIARAFHDELGVKTIPLVFSDDLLSGEVLRLPLCLAWEAELRPIFAAAGIGPRRKDRVVIRCLLASLPPGKEIPVHHDTGIWAMNSHRIHVPIITSSQTMASEGEVEFFSGVTDETLQRFPFSEGAVIELNNRAKHAVRNGWDKRRVHMIFDFVEDDIAARLRFIDVKPGMEIKQTRRSIITADGGSNVIHQDLAESEKIDCIPEPEARAKRTDEIVEFAEKIQDLAKTSNQELAAIEARIRVNVFLHGCKRYNAGELREDAFIRRLLSAFQREGLRILFERFELPKLVPDSERRNSLNQSYKRFLAGEDQLLLRPPSSIKPSIQGQVYFLIGAMKCGTSSLHSYIHQHPQCIPVHRQKEPHIFDWYWNQFCTLELKKDQVESVVKSGLISGDGEGMIDLHVKFLTALLDVDKIPSSMTSASSSRSPYFLGEATPSYLLGGSVIARRAFAVAPNAKIIVILRDPIARIKSQYAMIIDKENCTPEQRKRRGNAEGKSLDDLINEDLERLKDAKVSASCISPQFEARYSAFAPYGHGNHSYVGRGLYALQLEGWLEIFPASQFCVMFIEDITFDSKNGNEIAFINEAMVPVWNHLGVSERGAPGNNLIIREAAKKNVSNKAMKEKATITPELEKKLGQVYRAHNQRLKMVLRNIIQSGGYVSPQSDRYIESWSI